MKVDVIALGEDPLHLRLVCLPLRGALPPAAHLICHIFFLDVMAVSFLIPQLLILYNCLRYRLLRYPVRTEIDRMQSLQLRRSRRGPTDSLFDTKFHRLLLLCSECKNDIVSFPLNLYCKFNCSK